MLSPKNSEEFWVCPSDRHLLLRAKLNAGWSVRAIQTESKHRSDPLNSAELQQIRSVISRAEKVDYNEQKRIGSMVQSLENMRGKARGNGKSACLLCSEEFGKFVGASPLICMDCKKRMCHKCCVDFSSVSSLHHMQSHYSHRHKSLNNMWLCKVCNESREVWKRSGAWFFRALPKHILPEPKQASVSNRYTSQMTPNRYLSNSTDELNVSHRSVARQPSTDATYSHYKSIGRRRSSSSGSSDNDVPTVVVNEAKSTPSMAAMRNSTGSQNSEIFSPGYLDEIATPGIIAQGSLNKDKNSDLSPPQKRNFSGQKKKLKESNNIFGVDNTPKDNDTDNCSTSSAQSSVRDNVDLSSLHSSGVKQDAEESSGHVGGSYIERIYADLDNAGPLGSVEFTILYDPAKLALHVTVIRARNLKAMDINGFSDPYVKLHLLPGSKKSTKMRTQTKFKTLNPNFDETLTYWGITENDMSKKNLRLMVLDEDRFGHNDFIGEVNVTLRHLTPLQTKTFNMALDSHHALKKEEEEDTDTERGKLLLSMRFQSHDATLVVSVVRCAALATPIRNHSIDPQVKVCLQREDLSSSDVMCERTDRKKATKSANPAFQSVMKLPILGGSKELVKYKLDISVWDKDGLSREHLIGALHFGAKSKGSELRHWFDCIKQPGKNVEMWHNLALPDDAERISALSSAGRRRRTPRLPKKFQR